MSKRNKRKRKKVRNVKEKMAVKERLFLECGTVDMYNMKKYAGKALQLHHHPPYCKTRHTVYEESYLLTDENHKELHRAEQRSKEEYEEMMNIIKKNKRELENQVLMKKLTK